MTLQPAKTRERHEGHSSPAISVCHVISGGIWGGAEAYVSALLGALSDRPELTLSAILLKEGRLAQTLRSLAVDVKVIGAERHVSIASLFEATIFIRERQVQILHSHRYKENLISALLARRCNIPVLIRTEHGRYDSSSLKRRVVLAIDRLVGRYAADRIISVSLDLTRYLRHFEERKLIVIRNGIDVEQVRSHYNRATARAQLGFPEQAVIVGAASRLVRVKRLDLFLLTAMHIARAVPEARFVIAGSGPEEGNLRQLAAGTDLRGRIAFLGARDDIHDVLRALDLLVMTSDYEGIPMVLLEAMALEVPIVARPVGGIPEIIQDGVTGALVCSSDAGAIAEACICILKNRALADTLGKAARQSVMVNHSAQKNAEEILQLYRSLRCRPH